MGFLQAERVCVETLGRMDSDKKPLP
jgi:hypothetical protein